VQARRGELDWRVAISRTCAAVKQAIRGLIAPELERSAGQM